jgi:hypothetical protein
MVAYDPAYNRSFIRKTAAAAATAASESNELYAGQYHGNQDNDEEDDDEEEGDIEGDVNGVEYPRSTVSEEFATVVSVSSFSKLCTPGLRCALSLFIASTSSFFLIFLFLNMYIFHIQFQL